MKNKLRKLYKSFCKTFYIVLITAHSMNCLLYLHYTGLPRVTHSEIVESLALTLDSNNNFIQDKDYNKKKVESAGIPIPSIKPEYGYNKEYINSMNEFIERFI